ncbi:MAG: glutathione S-transferase N-terminal domain-containing protein, partial [Sinobacterium sp.]
MSDFILHHYQPSPFSEKIRTILGYKGLSYRAVTIPVVMPKPDLTALTGGYRKTPVLQQGAHVYCDTRLIARVIDAQTSEKTIYPKDQALSVFIFVILLEHGIF